VGCTTILVGKDASYDGSPLIARTEDSSAGKFDPKKVVVVRPEEQPRTYTSVLSHVTIELPGDPLRYTSVPNALPDEGLWASAGINAANVSMSATETLTSNPRVLGVDPLVELVPAQGEPGADGYRAEQPGGIGEEDMVTLVLPYIRSAREGVLRLGELLAQYGTYEMNGIAFGDTEEIWWLETVGGHHWIARRVPDDHYATIPNQLGIDHLDLDDAEGAGRDYLASPDLRRWMAAHHLDVTLRRASTAGFAAASISGAPSDGVFNPREAFGSHSDADHVYNTPRAWFMQRTLNPSDGEYDGPAARYRPDSDDLPWSRRPERKLTIEDVKDVLSSHYQGTEYDPYGSTGTAAQRGQFRPIGINRHNELSILQVRGDRPETSRGIQWVAYASNPFNTLVPLYTNVDRAPDYLGNTTAKVNTDSFYWASRLIATLTDPHFSEIIPEVERYQQSTLSLAHATIAAVDDGVARLVGADGTADPDAVQVLLEEANDAVTAQIREETDALLARVLFLASNGMRNRFSRSDG
jgi:dipeptidase